MKENSATGRRYDREFKQNAVDLVLWCDLAPM